MNHKLFTPLIGSVLGVVSWESCQNVMYSLIIAFVSGVVAWIAKFCCNWLYEKYKSKK